MCRATPAMSHTIAAAVAFRRHAGPDVPSGAGTANAADRSRSALTAIPA
ncbi:MAG TPA: hypothetical protein VN969_00180 [Streptosporangiaceae bacterium]|nr:hypothetical protein [Streptosporangiaceae bacterium]